MNARDLLIAARAKIEKPEAWTQGSAAKDMNGVPRLPLEFHACQWCMLGALAAAAEEARHRPDGSVLPWRAAHEAQDTAWLHLSDTVRYWDGQIVRYTVADFNDARHRKHADVLAAFDKAIASLEGA